MRKTRKLCTSRFRAVFLFPDMSVEKGHDDAPVLMVLGDRKQKNLTVL